MLKTRKRWISLLVAVAMVATLLVPFVGTASATSTYTVSYVAPLSANGSLAQATNSFLQVSVDTVQASLANGSTLYLDVPSAPTGYGIQLGAPQFTGVFATQSAGYTAAVATLAPTASTLFTVSTQSVYTEYRLSVAVTTGGSGLATSLPATSTISIPISYVVIPGGITGSVNLTASAPATSVFTNGSVTIATAGTGTVTLASESAPSIASGSAQPLGLIDITESMPGALLNSSSSTYAVKLTLPPGFTWATGTLGTPVWGTWAVTPAIILTSNGNRELDVDLSTASTSAVFAKLTSSVNVDSTVAKQGPVVLTIAGAATTTPSTLTIANYGAYSLSTKGLGAPTINSGAAGATIGEFQFSEGLPGSFVANRTIDLTLSGNVLWAQVPAIDASLTVNGVVNAGALNSAWTSVGTLGNVIELTFPAGSVATTTSGASAAVLVFKNAEVTPAIDYHGPITVTVSGTEGITGTLTLGNVVAPLTAAAVSNPNLAIGSLGVHVGDYTITETAAGNIQSVVTGSGLTTTGTILAANVTTSTAAELDIWAPTGCYFYAPPTATVTSGDLQIGVATLSFGGTANDQGEIVIPIKSSSTVASTITVTNITVTIDRTVPTGPLYFKTKGTGVDQTTIKGPLAASDVACFPNDSTAALAVPATIGTLSGAASGSAVFTIGQTTYSVNGKVYNIDAAPFIQDSRTFLPLRYVANAIGIADTNILWDANANAVTILSNGRVVQLVIGKNALSVNGAAVTMDTAPVISGGRTFLPIYWVATALGLQPPVWSATAQTATVTYGN